jgi:hypothetical protein
MRPRGRLGIKFATPPRALQALEISRAADAIPALGGATRGRAQGALLASFCRRIQGLRWLPAGFAQTVTGQGPLVGLNRQEAGRMDGLRDPSAKASWSWGFLPRACAKDCSCAWMHRFLGGAADTSSLTRPIPAQHISPPLLHVSPRSTTVASTTSLFPNSISTSLCLLKSLELVYPLFPPTSTSTTPTHTTTKTPQQDHHKTTAQNVPLHHHRTAPHSPPKQLHPLRPRRRRQLLPRTPHNLPLGRPHTGRPHYSRNPHAHLDLDRLLLLHLVDTALLLRPWRRRQRALDLVGAARAVVRRGVHARRGARQARHGGVCRAGRRGEHLQQCQEECWERQW